MGKLPAATTFLGTVKNFFMVVWQVIVALCRWIGYYLKKFWIWLRLHVPFLEAYIQRHAMNPSAIFVDLALLVLVIYVIFGSLGYYLVYHKKTEGRFTETLSILYPYPAARVNNSVIWSHRFFQRLRFLDTFNGQVPSDATSKPPTDVELRSQIMQGLVEDQVLLFEAKKLNVTVSTDEINQAYNAQKAKTDNFEQKIEQLYGMSVSEFKDVLAERLLQEKVKGAVLTRVRVRHILTSDLSAANQAKAALAAGTDFAAVAKQYSQDAQTKDTGGDLGYWTKGELAGQINQAFEDAAFSLPVNQISDPIQSQFGYHIIQVTEKTGSNYETYSDWLTGVEHNYKIKTYIPI
ncbi:MAG TPA: peptidylprolyl isomerase [Candidatus Saccharimonadales bacterium]|nr:peptidylprolyl isomerase [Candidatus Saccharimonadales bacterium]